jgi:hypothetical protein
VCWLQHLSHTGTKYLRSLEYPHKISKYFGRSDWKRF